MVSLYLRIITKMPQRETMVDATKILIEDFLERHEPEEIQEFINKQGDYLLEEYIKGTKYDLTCESCGGDLVYRDSEEAWVCISCELL